MHGGPDLGSITSILQQRMGGPATSYRGCKKKASLKGQRSLLEVDSTSFTTYPKPRQDDTARWPSVDTTAACLPTCEKCIEVDFSLCLPSHVD